MRGTNFRMLMAAMKPPRFVGRGLAAARFMRLPSLVSRETSASVSHFLVKKGFKIRAIEGNGTTC